MPGPRIPSGGWPRCSLPLPDREEFARSKRGRRKQEHILKAWEQACRQRWRALALAVKAKLEAVESGLSTLEEEFLAWILLPGNTTVGQLMRPQIERAYLTGDMPPGIAGLLPMEAEEAETVQDDGTRAD
ncbi:MAG TPA: hypothetical protein PK777_12075 [Thermoguttaceae bacterium]|nr:hypothetical protein [Thermoguttaceae bacterium]